MRTSGCSSERAPKKEQPSPNKSTVSSTKSTEINIMDPYGSSTNPTPRHTCQYTYKNRASSLREVTAQHTGLAQAATRWGIHLLTGGSAIEIYRYTYPCSSKAGHPLNLFAKIRIGEVSSLKNNIRGPSALNLTYTRFGQRSVSVQEQQDCLLESCLCS